MTVLYSVLLFFWGALFASFDHVVAHRLIHKEPITGRSYCPNCLATLRFIDVIPILGYLINRGRCHTCQEKIDKEYLGVELIGGLIWVGLYLRFGWTLELIVGIILWNVLLIESLSDRWKKTVIDKVWMIGLVPLVVIRIIESSLNHYFLSAAVMFVGLMLIAIIAQKLTHKEVLGGGDIKLFLFIGFALPLPEAFLSLFIGSLLGLAYAWLKKIKKSDYLPLVPFLSLGVLISFMVGGLMIDTYLHWLGM